MTTDYLNAHCDALAMAISKHSGCGIKTLHAVHLRADGSRSMDRDFLHAYAFDEDGPLDAKGRRSEESMVDDFLPLAQSLKMPGDQSMTIETIEHDGWTEMIEALDVDPDEGRIDEAWEHAARNGIVRE